MQIRLPREYVDQPLLKRVAASYVYRTLTTTKFSIMIFPHVIFLTLIDWQVRELADEEMLEDVELQFE